MADISVPIPGLDPAVQVQVMHRPQTMPVLGPTPRSRALFE